MTNFLAAANPLAVDENPAITSIVLEALSQLQQITAGLNFFGFAPDYVPPFSFEYLQNTARYFAPAGLADRAALHPVQEHGRERGAAPRATRPAGGSGPADRDPRTARRGRGAGGHRRGAGQPQLRRGAAPECRQQSQERLRQRALGTAGLAELEAWANATSVRHETTRSSSTSTGYEYYQARLEARASRCCKDLAYQRTRISHDLEAAKLQRAIDAANAYKGDGAGAGEPGAGPQRRRRSSACEIAQLQQQQAEENRDFLDMREFSARLWYELAAQARRLTRRYLDMATEIAFLMERAYNAETERGLQRHPLRLQPHAAEQPDGRRSAAGRHRLLHARPRHDDASQRRRR